MQGPASRVAVASVSAPSLSEGDHVNLSCDLSGGLRTTGGGGGGGGACTIADGADVAEGATTDAAVYTDTTGTVSGKLRGIVKILAAVADIASGWFKVSIQNATLAVTQSGSWVLAAGAAIIGKVGIDQTTPGTTNKVSIGTDGTVAATQSGTWAVGLTPQTSGGLSKFHLVSAATTNATNVKASAGQLFGWYIYNSNAAARKLCLHNTAGTPTAGASVTDSFVIPAGGAANVFSDTGIAFSTGIAITTVTGLADSDNTAVSLNDLVINLYYK